MHDAVEVIDLSERVHLTRLHLQEVVLLSYETKPRVRLRQEVMSTVRAHTDHSTKQAVCFHTIVFFIITLSHVLNNIIIILFIMINYTSNVLLCQRICSVNQSTVCPACTGKIPKYSWVVRMTTPHTRKQHISCLLPLIIMKDSKIICFEIFHVIKGQNTVTNNIL